MVCFSVPSKNLGGGKNIKRTYSKLKEKPITEIMQKMLTIKICGCII